MAQDNVNTVRGMYAAFAKGEIPTIIAALDPQVEWWETRLSPLATDLRG